MSVSQVSACLSAQEAGVLALLLPCLAVTAVDRAVISGDLVSIWVRAAADGAACPGCGTWCTKVRGGYWRRLRDTAAGGRRVLIWLRVRLLRCGSTGCAEGSFAEQPAGLAVPYARKTPLLAGQLAAVAVALGASQSPGRRWPPGWPWRSAGTRLDLGAACAAGAGGRADPGTGRR